MRESQRWLYGDYPWQLDEDGVYTDSDDGIDLIERSWRWADLNPERAKASAEYDEPSTT